MIKPPKLKPGDKVATVSLSWGGPGTFPHRYQIGVRQLQDVFNLEVVGAPHVLAEDAYLHANPQARADDLMWAFSDPSIKAIISTIGGDDSIRILPYLDLDVIRANPKVFMGYSNTTITHLACFKAGLVSFYGPAIMAGFGENGGLFPYMVDSVRKTLFSADPIGTIHPNKDGWTVEHLDWANPDNQSRRRKLTPSTSWEFIQGSGIHEGYLVGGNIDVLDWLRGTEFWPSPGQWQDAILFLETSEGGITPDQLKYFLRPYLALGVFERIIPLVSGAPRR